MNISVVVATYNRASLLEAALEELRHQQYDADDEVIVVDNGSTDATADVIAHAARRFPVPVHQVRELRPGKTAALNAGLASAQGAVLALTDDDVLVGRDWIATIRQLFGDSSIALAGGRVDPLWERPAPRWLQVERQGTYGPMSSPLALLHYGEAQPLGARTAVGANLAVRRTVVDALAGFAPNLGRHRGTLLSGEDHDFCQRAIAAGYRCEYRPELRVRHWVPVERMRLSYYARWFFWSGVANAVLEHTRTGSRASERTLPWYFLRRLVTAPLSALRLSLVGRRADAAAHLMEAAFALGYITQRIRDRQDDGTVSRLDDQTPGPTREHAASAQSPEMPVVGTSNN